MVYVILVEWKKSNTWMCTINDLPFCMFECEKNEYGLKCAKNTGIRVLAMVWVQEQCEKQKAKKQFSQKHILHLHHE